MVGSILFAIETKDEYMRNELAEEIRMFAAEEDADIVVKHCAEPLQGYMRHTVKVTMGDKQTSAQIEGAALDEQPMIKKRLDKRAAKLAVYQCMVQLTGRTQPWGSLTGVRPVNLLRQLEAEGAQDQFVEMLGVHPEKAQLAESIIERQDAMMRETDQSSLCIYVGIPFCITRCSYCSFPAVVAKKGQRESYVAALLQEIEAAGEMIRRQHKSICAVYMGGGTPTALTDQQMRCVMEAMQRAFGTGYEYTLEAGRPDTITREKLGIARMYGVNRLCINPQTMQNKTLERIGRRHTAEDIEACYALARQEGFTHINADLIAGLPGETEEDFADTLKWVEHLAPSSLTCHTLALKRGSKLIEDHYAHGNADTVSRMVDMAREKAAEMGMGPYYLYRQKHMAGNLENVGYAKTGDACLYNVAMMDEMLDVVGLGVGAVGKRIIGNKIQRQPNPRDIGVYLERIHTICEQKAAFFHG